jgi:hypothetical protein
VPENKPQEGSDKKYDPSEEAVKIYNPQKEKAIEQIIPESHKGLEAVVQEKADVAPVKSTPYEPKEEKKVKRTGKIVEYPDEGTLFVATDLHGDMDALEKVVEAFEKKYAENAAVGKQTYLLTLGDDIHCDPDDYEVDEHGFEFDYSYKVLDRFDELRRKYGEDAVINLMGNHELAHLEIDGLQYAIKDNINQCTPFKRGLRKAIGKWEEGQGWEEVKAYVDNMRNRPLMALTAQGLILSHSGPTKNISLEQVRKAEYTSHYELLLEQILIRRIHEGLRQEKNYYLRKEEIYINAAEKMIESFNAKALIVGHTPPTDRFFFNTAKTVMGDSYTLLGNKVMVFSTGKTDSMEGHFLEIELGQKETLRDIISGI